MKNTSKDGSSDHAQLVMEADIMTTMAAQNAEHVTVPVKKPINQTTMSNESLANKLVYSFEWKVTMSVYNKRTKKNVEKYCETVIAATPLQARYNAKMNKKRHIDVRHIVSVTEPRLAFAYYKESLDDAPKDIKNQIPVPDEWFNETKEDIK